MSPNKTLPADHFLRLCDARNEDHRQDQYVALLQGAPQSEREALALLRTVHHRQETSRRRERKRTVQLSFDPVAPQSIDSDGHMVSALSRMAFDEQAIINDHVVSGMSFRVIAKQQGVSKDSIRKRYDHAKKKLQALVKIQ